MNNYEEIYDGLFRVYPNGIIERKKKDRYINTCQYNTANGYKSVSATINGKQKHFLVHRLVATAFLPNPSKKPYINHIDGNRINNDLSNLEWCTSKENTQHAMKIGHISFSTYAKAGETRKKNQEINPTTSFPVYLPKSAKTKLLQYAADNGHESLNAYVRKLIAEDSGLDL